jgi:hypothetical protein
MRTTSALGLVSGLAVAGVMSLTGTGLLQPAIAAVRPAAQPVAETNLDANGLIRVHEQGTADTRVTNLPIAAGGGLAVEGTVGIEGTIPVIGKLEVDGPVEIAKMPSVTIAGTPTVHLDNAIKLDPPTAGTLAYSALSGLPSGHPDNPILLGDDPRVTSVSLWASSDAHFQLGGDATFSIHVKAGTNVVHSFVTPLRSKFLDVTCPGGCDVSISVVGYES